MQYLLDGLDQPFLTLLPGLIRRRCEVFADLLLCEVKYFATVICEWGQLGV